MKMRAFFLAIAVFSFWVYLQIAPGHAQTTPPIGLTGLVSSVEEGPMEGVLVSAKKAGSTMTITVVSNEEGRYRFPSAKLAPGQYALRVRAVGFDLERPSTIEVGSGKTALADLKLRKASDPAAQLSNAEWFASYRAPSNKRLLSGTARTVTRWSVSCGHAPTLRLQRR
jgi:hypothetical protein